MQETIDLIAKYGYVILFLYSLGGGFIALVGASVLSFAGKMDLSLSIFVAIVANFLGDWLLFYMARYQKSMMQPYLTQHRRKLALVHILMRKYGSIIIVVKKYIYGLKTLVPLAIALTPYSLAKFNLYNAIGAIVWGISIGLLGYFSGGILIKGFEMLGEYPLLAPLFILVLLGGLWLWLKQATRK
ncbi:DedA family protein [Helicobacter winghamensis]|uniref:DedA family protein n=1 Tax=Helicobacter winghamensis TaxID=157268 RepID=UPI0027A3DC3E